jgi:hypothetical protein
MGTSSWPGEETENKLVAISLTMSSLEVIPQTSLTRLFLPSKKKSALHDAKPKPLQFNLFF